MAEDSTTPEVVHSLKAKAVLRTYSRRVLKRRLTSPPLSVDAKISQSTQSFAAAAPEIESGNQRSPEHKSANAGRKRARLSLPAANGKSPTELFLEHMTSPFVLSQQLQQREQGLKHGLQIDQEKIALVEANQDDDVAFEDNKPAEEPAKVLRERLSTVEACDALKVAPTEKAGSGNENPEEPDDDNGKESPTKRIQSLADTEFSGPSDVGPDFFDTANQSSSRRVRRFKLLSLSPPVNQKSNAKGRFLDAPKSPTPPGFKTIPKLQSRLGIAVYDQQRRGTSKAFKIIKPTNDQPFKVDKNVSDGFTNDEAQPSPYRKTERRIKNTLTETHIGGLDLTQTGAATQKMEGPTWLRGQKRSRAATTASLWGKRHYLGSSQFQIEYQDPLEASNIDEEPESENIHNAGRSGSLINEIADDEEAELDLLIHPDELDRQSNQGDAGEDIDILVETENQQERMEQYISDADEHVVLLEVPGYGDEDDLATIPRMDTPEPAVGDLSSKTRFGS